MILIDNHDSFTYNIVQYVRELGISPLVIKNDEKTLDEIQKLKFESIIISPGPSNPDNAGISVPLIEKFHKTKKILGICLGHQCIAQSFGCNIVKAENPVHGKVSEIFFNEGELLFRNVKQGFLATRYHSLTVDPLTLTDPLEAIAYTKDNIIMAIKHKKYSLYGVQFHPEAILTESGKLILKNFIAL